MPAEAHHASLPFRCSCRVCLQKCGLRAGPQALHRLQLCIVELNGAPDGRCQGLWAQERRGPRRDAS